MSRKSVAVLDIRSSEVTVVVGERGVNNTFVFKGSKTEPYDGYEGGAFYDVPKLKDAIFRALNAVEKATSEHIRTLYIGVPGEFSTVLPREVETGFPKKRKIGEREVGEVFEKGKSELEGFRFIRATSMIFVTADNRRVVDPVGLSSTSLDGVLSYFYCTDYFAETMEKIFANMRIALKFLPTSFAMASYLIPSETRDEYAIFLDAGFLSSTISVILGGGVLAQRTFWVGKAQIAVLLMEEFDLPYDAACALLSKANLYAKGGESKMEFSFRGYTYEIDVQRLIATVKEGLDKICEAVGGFLDDCSGRELDYKPLYISGEGIYEIRGALEHIAGRIERVTEMLSPDLPYYNRPTMSSRIALIDMAYEDNRKGGMFSRLFNGFGG